MAKNVRINVKTEGGYDVLHPETEAGQVVMAGYAKPAAGGAVTAADTAGEAIGKLEKGVEDSIPKADIVQVRGRSETKVMSQKAVTDAIDAGGGGGGGGADDAEPVGVIKPFAGETLPDGYLWCDGASYPANGDYLKLYEVVGTAYNEAGDAAGTFRAPDLRGRVTVGKNTGTFDALGKTGGEETHTLTTEEMPAHNHAFSGQSAATNSTGAHTHNPAVQANFYTQGKGQLNGEMFVATASGGAQTYLTAGTNSAGAHTHTLTAKGTISNAGSNTPHNNLQPYLVCNYIIKYGKTYGETGVTAPPCIWEFSAADWTQQDGKYILSIPESEHRRGEYCVLTALYDTGEAGVMKSLLSENTKDAEGNITVYSDTAFAGKAYIDRVYMVPAGRVLTVNGQSPDVDGDVTVAEVENAQKLGGELPGYYAKQSDMTSVLAQPEIKKAAPLNGATLGTNYIWEDEKTVFIRISASKDNDGIANQMKVASIAGLGIEIPQVEVWGIRNVGLKADGTFIMTDSVLMPTGEIRTSHNVNQPVKSIGIFIIYPKGAN